MFSPCSLSDFDTVTPLIKAAVKGTLVAVGGIAVAVIANIACKALGFSKLTTAVATAIPVAISALGVASSAAAVLGLTFQAVILIGCVIAIKRLF
jgi:hypothetical protein